MSLSAEQIRHRLQATEAALNSPVISTLELPDTGARRARNRAREDAWLALDRERDWLRLALALSPAKPFSPCPAAPRTGLVALALNAAGGAA